MTIRIERICVPTDFSEAADQAVHYGADLARVHGAQLHLLHVFEHSDSLVHHPDFTAQGEVARAYFNEMQVDALEQEPPTVSSEEAVDQETHAFLRSLEEGVDRRWKELPKQNAWWEDLDVHRAVRYGRPAEEICRYVAHYLIDQVIMPTHARKGFARWLMGSVTDRVVRASVCPVVVLRFPAHEYKLVEHA